MTYTPSFHIGQVVDVPGIGQQTIKRLTIRDSLIHGNRHISYDYDTLSYCIIPEKNIKSSTDPIEIDVPNRYNVGDHVCVFFKGQYYNLPIEGVNIYVGKDTIEWDYSFEIALIKFVPECCVKWHKKDFKADDFTEIYQILNLKYG